MSEAVNGQHIEVIFITIEKHLGPAPIIRAHCHANVQEACTKLKRSVLWAEAGPLASSIDMAVRPY